MWADQTCGRQTAVGLHRQQKHQVKARGKQQRDDKNKWKTQENKQFGESEHLAQGKIKKYRLKHRFGFRLIDLRGWKTISSYRKDLSFSSPDWRKNLRCTQFIDEIRQWRCEALKYRGFI